MNVTRRQGAQRGVAGIAVEGACDFSLGRPFDANPYAGRKTDAGKAWRFGWLEASWFNQSGGDAETRRWAA